MKQAASISELEAGRCPAGFRPFKCEWQGDDKETCPWNEAVPEEMRKLTSEIPVGYTLVDGKTVLHDRFLAAQPV